MIVGAKPRFLASVRSLEEAHTAARVGAELIDLKEPSQGALGAVGIGEQQRIVAALAGLGRLRPPVSATVGDLPFEPAILVDAIRRTAETGVDIVKFGVYSSGETARQGFLELDRLLSEKPSSVALVALLLVDRLAGFDEVMALSRAALRVRGVRGVMLDTAEKGAGARCLPDILCCAELARFVAAVHDHDGFAGLAGCLAIEHIEALATTAADILGFRGALCGGTRTDALDERAFVRVYDRLQAARVSSSAAVSAA
jgi:uncharacterized protein (UPF0264 family)